MKILFVGFVIPRRIMDGIWQKDPIAQVAADKLQWSLIGGIEKASGRPIDLIGSAPCSDYPRFRRILMRGLKWCHCNESADVMIPFINILILKHISRYITCFLFVLAWLVKNRRYGQRFVVVYALHSPHVLAAQTATRLLGGKTVLIVPDHPLYMDSGRRRNFVRKICKVMDCLLLMKCMKRAEGLIVLTRQMTEDFAPNVPSLVVEGAVSSTYGGDEIEKTISETRHENNVKVVMYTGTLVGAHGLRLLLDAFNLIRNGNYRLWISGKGDIQGEIANAAKRDKRITYWGFRPLEEISRKALEATVLVNPRPSNMEFVAYSFPSKLLEYMITGRPVITTNLPGIPEEYHEYVYLLEDESPEGLAGLIEEVCSKEPEELDDFGQRARKFVLDKKTHLRQGQRIYEFLGNLS